MPTAGDDEYAKVARDEAQQLGRLALDGLVKDVFMRDERLPLGEYRSDRNKIRNKSEREDGIPCRRRVS